MRVRHPGGLLPYAYLAPALVLLAVLSLIPNLYSVYLAFTNYSLYHYTEFEWVGLRNFARILSGPEVRTFGRVLVWTVGWAAGSVGLSLAVGLGLALLLNNPRLGGRNLYRTLFIIPWAIPAFISVMMWQGLLNTELGAVNQVLEITGVNGVLARLFGLERIPWLVDDGWARAAVLLVNAWLGFPFMMTVCLGALQSIPGELYEASSVDGATPLRQFWTITVPGLRHAMVPVLVSSFAFNFNQFNAIYLLTGGGPAISGSDAGATDILLTYSYKLAFDLFQYGMACAYALFIFLIVAALSAVNLKLSGAFEETT